MGDPKESLRKFLSEISEKHPNDPVAQAGELGMFYQQHGQEARDAFRELIGDSASIAEITHEANRVHKRAGVKDVNEDMVLELLKIIGRAAENGGNVNWAVRSRLFEDFD